MSQVASPRLPVIIPPSQASFPHPATLPEDVYGHAFLFGFAQAVAYLAPCVFSLALLAVLLRLLTSWRTYSPLGLALRMTALLLTLGLAALTVDSTPRLSIWGLD